LNNVLRIPLIGPAVAGVVAVVAGGIGGVDAGEIILICNLSNIEGSSM